MYLYQNLEHNSLRHHFDIAQSLSRPAYQFDIIWLPLEEKINEH